MDKFKQKFDEQEKQQREEFEHFLKKNKDNYFLTNCKMLQMKLYHYKEFVKIFANNYQSDYFAKSKRSVYSILFLPGVTLACFNLLAPFSLFKPIFVYSSLFGCTFSLILSMSNELDYIARKDKGSLGKVVRYRFQQLSAFDT